MIYIMICIIYDIYMYHIYLWQSTKVGTEFSFRRMTLTMMVYFSKWKNRCKFYFDQRPRNWATIKCGTTVCQLTFAWKCFWKTVSSKRLSGLFIRSCHHNNPVQLSFGLNTCYSSLGLIITQVCVLMEGFPYQKSKQTSFCDCKVVRISCSCFLCSNNIKLFNVIVLV